MEIKKRVGIMRQAQAIDLSISFYKCWLKFTYAAINATLQTNKLVEIVT